MQVLASPIFCSGKLCAIKHKAHAFKTLMKACTICLIAQSGLGQFELIHQSYQKIFKMVISKGVSVVKPWDGSKTCSNGSGLSIAPTPDRFGDVQAKILITFQNGPHPPKNKNSLLQA